MEKVAIDSIIERLKSVIENEGAASSGWAIRDYFGKDHRAAEHEIEKISSSITSTGEFIRSRDFSKMDYYISRNPNFLLNENMKSTNNSIQRLNGLLRTTNILTVALAAITGVFIGIDVFNHSSTSLKPIILQIEQLNRTQDSLLRVQKSIDKTLRLIAHQDSTVDKNLKGEKKYSQKFANPTDSGNKK